MQICIQGGEWMYWNIAGMAVCLIAASLWIPKGIQGVTDFGSSFSVGGGVSLDGADRRSEEENCQK